MRYQAFPTTLFFRTFPHGPLLVLALLLTTVSTVSGQTRLTDRQTEYLIEPLGLETTPPRFRWNMTTADHRRGARQVSYLVGVMDEQGRAVWNSGKVSSANALNVAYAGQALQPRARYDRTVEIEAKTANRLATNTEITYTFVVPAGTMATLRLPAPSKSRIKESGKVVGKAKGVSSNGWADGRALFTLGQVLTGSTFRSLKPCLLT